MLYQRAASVMLSHTIRFEIYSDDGSLFGLRYYMLCDEGTGSKIRIMGHTTACLFMHAVSRGVGIVRIESDCQSLFVVHERTKVDVIARQGEMVTISMGVAIASRLPDRLQMFFSALCQTDSEAFIPMLPAHYIPLVKEIDLEQDPTLPPDAFGLFMKAYGPHAEAVEMVDHCPDFRLHLRRFLSFLSHAPKCDEWGDISGDDSHRVTMDESSSFLDE